MSKRNSVHTETASHYVDDSQDINMTLFQKRVLFLVSKQIGFDAYNVAGLRRSGHSAARTGSQSNTDGAVTTKTTIVRCNASNPSHPSKFGEALVRDSLARMLSASSTNEY